jgi:hypothetical protein
MELHTGSGHPRSAMMPTLWIWSEVDTVVEDTELFPVLAASSVLDDNDGLGSDLGLIWARLFYLLLKIDF